MCRARYGSDAANALIEQWMGGLQRAAYLASAELAAEKGAFPLYNAARYAESPTIQCLDDDVRAAIDASGVRNALLTSVAPTGTISLLAGNVSSGVEPVFSYSYTRNVLMPDGTRRAESVDDHAYLLFRRLKGDSAPLPDYFVDAQSLRPADHLTVQAQAQPSSTAPSPRPSTALRRWNSTISRTSTCGPTISAARAVPPIGLTR